MRENNIGHGIFPVLDETFYRSLQQLEREILETVFDASGPEVNGEPAGLRDVVICRLLSGVCEEDQLKEVVVQLAKLGLLVTQRHGGKMFFQIRDEDEAFLEAKLYGE